MCRELCETLPRGKKSSTSIVRVRSVEKYQRWYAGLKTARPEGLARLRSDDGRAATVETTTLSTTTTTTMAAMRDARERRVVMPEIPVPRVPVCSAEQRDLSE